MDINTDKDKSEVISPDGASGDFWSVKDGQGEIDLSLKQVIQYKYLGSPTLGSMHRNGVEKQKSCVAKAHRYKGSCIHISKDGPDVVDVVLATWCNIVVPAILHGCEAVPFT